MRFNLALAIFVSLLLVGGASWSRFAPSDKQEASLIAVETKRQADEEYYNQVVLPVLEKSATSSIATAEPLTATDLVGRQLLSEYLSIAASGKVSEENINKLADKYIENIPSLSTSQQISLQNLSITSNSRENFRKYADEFLKIHSYFTDSINGLYPVQGDFSVFAKKLSEIYINTSSQMKSLSAPAALANLHLELTNSYLSSYSGLLSLGKMEADPATGFAGLVAISQNLGVENKIMTEIEGILTTYGI